MKLGSEGVNEYVNEGDRGSQGRHKVVLVREEVRDVVDRDRTSRLSLMVSHGSVNEGQLLLWG